MGEVHEYMEGLAAFDTFQPAGHACHRFQPAHDRRQVDAVGRADGGSKQAVSDIVLADQRRTNRNGFVAGVQQEGLLAREAFQRHGRYFGRRVEAHRKHRPVAPRQEGGGPRIVGVDDREALWEQVVEELELGRAIVVLGPVIIEVISLHIRDAGHIEFNACDAGLGQGVTRDLHHRVRTAVGRHPRQPLGEHRRRRRRPRCVGRLDAITVSKRAQQARLKAGGR
jgi:hypothetical protein